MFYIISAALATQDDNGNWLRVTQLPTFILDSNIQGIVNVEHARQIAASILNPFEDKDITVDMSVTETEIA